MDILILRNSLCSDSDVKKNFQKLELMTLEPETMSVVIPVVEK